ncbi:transcriptional accessory protein [Arthrobacter sp. MWB30]|nr:transcriptional accessory protein [Arthrobacter sp. MWB30]
MSELEKPGRDPRPAFKAASFSEGIEKISDLKPGMILEGTVTNVAAFGAFVDVGVHQDGLVHVSALSNKFVSDPREIVKSGQVVRVKVLEADPERKRISLTLGLDDEPGSAGGRTSGGRAAGGRDSGGQPGQRGGGQSGQRGGQPGQRQGQGSPQQRSPRQGKPQQTQAAPANTAMAEALRRAGLGK